MTSLQSLARKPARRCCVTALVLIAGCESPLPVPDAGSDASSNPDAPPLDAGPDAFARDAPPFVIAPHEPFLRSTTKVATRCRTRRS